MSRFLMVHCVHCMSSQRTIVTGITQFSVQYLNSLSLISSNWHVCYVNVLLQCSAALRF